MSSQQLQQAFFISVTNNGRQDDGSISLFLQTFGPNCPAPNGASIVGGASWQKLEPTDIFTYSLVSNPSPGQPEHPASKKLEHLADQDPFSGQLITLENLGVAAGATFSLNLLIQSKEPNVVEKIVVPGLTPFAGSGTFTAGSENSTTPL